MELTFPQSGTFVFKSVYMLGHHKRNVSSLISKGLYADVKTDIQSDCWGILWPLEGCAGGSGDLEDTWLGLLGLLGRASSRRTTVPVLSPGEASFRGRRWAQCSGWAAGCTRRCGV